MSVTMNDFIKKYIKTPTNIVDVINISNLTHENEIKINIMSNSAADIAIDVDDDNDDDDVDNIRYGEITTNEENIELSFKKSELKNWIRANIRNLDGDIVLISNPIFFH
jgi:hypothetical protein